MERGVKWSEGWSRLWVELINSRHFDAELLNQDVSLKGLREPGDSHGG